MTSPSRSEEHTSELQSRQYLVCRLLLEKKKNQGRLELLSQQILTAAYLFGYHRLGRRNCVRPDERLFPFFFFNDTATTEIYTLSLHDALPIDSPSAPDLRHVLQVQPVLVRLRRVPQQVHRSEEHTSELQSRQYLVCRLLLEKKKTNNTHFVPNKKEKHTNQQTT